MTLQRIVLNAQKILTHNGVMGNPTAATSAHQSTRFNYHSHSSTPQALQRPVKGIGAQSNYSTGWGTESGRLDYGCLGYHRALRIRWSSVPDSRRTESHERPRIC